MHGQQNLKKSLFEFDKRNVYYMHAFISRMIFALLEYLTLFINFDRGSAIACRYKF